MSFCQRCGKQRAGEGHDVCFWCFKLEEEPRMVLAQNSNGSVGRLHLPKVKYGKADQALGLIRDLEARMQRLEDDAADLRELVHTYAIALGAQIEAVKRGE